MGEKISRKEILANIDRVVETSDMNTLALLAARTQAMHDSKGDPELYKLNASLYEEMALRAKFRETNAIVLRSHPEDYARVSGYEEVTD